MFSQAPKFEFSLGTLERRTGGRSKDARLRASLTGLAVEQFPGRVGVPGVSSSLVDQMQYHPAQVVAFRPVAGIRLLSQFQGMDDGVSRDWLQSVGIESGIDGHVGPGSKLLLAAAYLGTTEPTVDPPPLDLGEVTDDAQKRDQAALGPPSRLVVIDAVQLSRNRSA